MATPVIKLEPVRMGSLMNSGSSPLAPGQKYLPPNMRGTTADTGPVTIDLGANSFPTLGSAPKKAVGWGKHVVKIMPAPPDKIPTVPLPDPSKVSENMRDKIKGQIRMEEEQRQKPREENPYKMTREELLADGWAVLSMAGENVKEVIGRLNTPLPKASLTSEDYYE